MSVLKWVLMSLVLPLSGGCYASPEPLELRGGDTVYLPNDFERYGGLAVAIGNASLVEQDALKKALTLAVGVWGSDLFSDALSRYSSHLIYDCMTNSASDTGSVVKDLINLAQPFNLVVSDMQGISDDIIGYASISTSMIVIRDTYILRATKSELAGLLTHEVLHLVPDLKGDFKYIDSDCVDTDFVATYVLGAMVTHLTD